MAATEDAHGLLCRAAAAWGVSLDAERSARIDWYVSELLAANRKTNLTADTDPEILLLRHVADGLAAAGVLIKEAPQTSPTILDLGSGGGCIGMAIKIAWPQARVTLMESVQRKYRFLNAMAARSGLAGLTVSSRRAGQGALPAAQSGFDAVVARAVAPLPEAIGLGLPMASPSGLFLAFQTSRPDPEEPNLRRALARHAARLVQSFPYRLPREDQDRHLVLFRRLQTG